MPEAGRARLRPSRTVRTLHGSAGASPSHFGPSPLRGGTESISDSALRTELTVILRRQTPAVETVQSGYHA